MTTDSITASDLPRNHRHPDTGNPQPQFNTLQEFFTDQGASLQAQSACSHSDRSIGVVVRGSGGARPGQGGTILMKLSHTTVLPHLRYNCLLPDG